MTALLWGVGPPLVVAAAAAAVLAVALAVVALRNRSAPGAGWLAAVLVIDAVVVAFAAAGHLLPRTRGIALAVGGLGLLAAVPFLAFVVAYTGRGRHLTYPSLLGYGGPLFVAAALYATSGYHDLVLAGPVGAERVGGIVVLTAAGRGPLLVPALAYVALLLVGAVLLVLQTVVRHERLYLGQSGALLAAVAAPLAATLPSVGGRRAVAAAAALVGVATLALAYAAGRRRLFDSVPAVRQLGDRAAIDDLDEGILIVDDGENVVKLNDAAAAILDCDPAGAVGRPAAALFVDVGVEDPTATPTTFERTGGTYEVTSSPITDERDRPIGRTFVLRDVSSRERRKQRLQVLNRVLRHNVRNDMSVVRTHASIVAEEGGPRLADLGENMVETADELVAIGEQVRRTEQLLSVEELSVQDVDVGNLLSAVVDGVRTADRGAVDATVSVADDVDRLAVNHSLLELALENVVENAVVHNDRAVPTLAVTADRVGGGVRLTVADDGPGIPLQEVAALEAGRETDLQHASSLGLWVVLWSVGRLGGDLRIEHLEPTGTAVAIWLPDPDAAPEDEDATAATDASPDDAGPRVDPAAVAMVAEGVADDDAATEPDVAVGGAADGPTSADAGGAGSAADMPGASEAGDTRPSGTAGSGDRNPPDTDPDAGVASTVAALRGATGGDDDAVDGEETGTSATGTEGRAPGPNSALPPPPPASARIPDDDGEPDGVEESDGDEGSPADPDDAEGAVADAPEPGAEGASTRDGDHSSTDRGDVS